MSFIHAGSLEAYTLFTVGRQRSTRITGRLKDKQTPQANAILDFKNKFSTGNNCLLKRLSALGKFIYYGEDC
jgi:hypothetical protein